MVDELFVFGSSACQPLLIAPGCSSDGEQVEK
jgi:hypothetical protein